MNNNLLVVSETKKPFWKLILAALCFTAIFGIILASVLYNFFILNSFKSIANLTEILIYLAAIGIGLSSHKKVYINLKQSKFRPTIEVGPIKVGKWVTIKNYEYVSVFHQLLVNGSYVFEVNLWYNNNKHFKLYEKNSFNEAMALGYEISEELNIELLDATVPNNYTWVDKEELKEKHKNHAS
ncbi:MAG: hypothetical protein ACPG6B_00175 [Oceanihabitans sp.]